MTGWRLKLAAVRDRCRSRGLSGVARGLANAFRSLIWQKKNDEWLAHKERVDRFFDSKFNIDTRGITQLSGLEITGTHRPDGIAHIASDPDEFSRALASVHIEHKDFVFVDLGSGKGRALLLALSFPFRRIVGVEFALEFHLIAQTNLLRFAAATNINVGRVTLIRDDATEFELPTEPLVIYLYNPFNDQVMKKVADRVLKSHIDHPRPIYIVYGNAFLEKLWTDSGFVVLERGATFSLLAPPVPAAEADPEI